jgi:hypothetical protein
MRKLLILSLLIITIFGLTGCTLINPGNVTVFSSFGNASISVPSGWNTSDTAITKVFPAAVIAASNPANHEYLAVIGEPKSLLGANSTINTFFAQIKAGSVATIANGAWGTLSAITVDGLSGLTVQATGVYRQSKANSTFFLNVLANNNYYYAVLAFTDTTLVSINEVTLKSVINSFNAPANTVIQGTWKPYTFPQSVILAFILLIIGLGLVFLGRRLKRSVEVPHPGKRLKIAMITVWALLILFIIGVIVFYRIGRTAIGTGRTGIGPIFPITLACAAGAFIYIAYIYRHDGILTALGRAFVCGAAGPMVFEFPFDMIVIPQIKTTATLLIAEFVPLDFAVLLTLSLLLLSKRVSITRYSLYALGAMFIVFAVWAWFGFSYPSNPISYVSNAISKVLGFLTIVFLFSKESKQIAEKPISTETTNR